MTEEELALHERLAPLDDWQLEFGDPSSTTSILALVAEVRRLKERERQALLVQGRQEAMAVAQEREACIHAVVQYHARDIPHEEPGCQCYEIEQLLRERG